MFSSKITTTCLIGVAVTTGPLCLAGGIRLVARPHRAGSRDEANAAPPTTSAVMRDVLFHVLGLMPTIRLLLKCDIALRNVAEAAGTATAVMGRSAERYMNPW